MGIKGWDISHHLITKFDWSYGWLKNILEKNLETMPLSKKLSVQKKNQEKIGTSKCISWDNHNYVVILLAN
jgi:hypothetical protein